MKNDNFNIDISKIYDYKSFPDKVSGRCDLCNNAHFESAIKKGGFLRKCRNCGLTKKL